MLDIIKSPRSLRDLVDHFEYIAKDRLSAARKFLTSVRSTLDSLAGFPGIGRRFESDHPRLQGIRVTTVKSFRNYLLFYRPTESDLEVLTIIHGARDLPGILERLAEQRFR